MRIAILLAGHAMKAYVLSAPLWALSLAAAVCQGALPPAVEARHGMVAAATSTMFLNSHGEPIEGASLDGYLAVGVPGTVLGLDSALRRYGTLP
jgi:hypothetical protein